MVIITVNNTDPALPRYSDTSWPRNPRPKRVVPLRATLSARAAAGRRVVLQQPEKDQQHDARHRSDACHRDGRPAARGRRAGSRPAPPRTAAAPPTGGPTPEVTQRRRSPEDHLHNVDRSQGFSVEPLVGFLDFCRVQPRAGSDAGHGLLGRDDTFCPRRAPGPGGRSASASVTREAQFSSWYRSISWGLSGRDWGVPGLPPGPRRTPVLAP